MHLHWKVPLFDLERSVALWKTNLTQTRSTDLEGDVRSAWISNLPSCLLMVLGNH